MTLALIAEGVASITPAAHSAKRSAVEEKRLDAFVGSAPVLNRYKSEGGYDLEVGTTSSEPQRWAFAVGEGAPLREPLGRAVLEQTRGAAWRALLDRYLQSGS